MNKTDGVNRSKPLPSEVAGEVAAWILLRETA